MRSLASGSSGGRRQSIQGEAAILARKSRSENGEYSPAGLAILLPWNSTPTLVFAQCALVTTASTVDFSWPLPPPTFTAGPFVRKVYCLGLIIIERDDVAPFFEG